MEERRKRDTFADDSSQFSCAAERLSVHGMFPVQCMHFNSSLYCMSASLGAELLNIKNE